CLDSGTAPETKAGRRGSVGAGVECDLLLRKSCRYRLCDLGLQRLVPGDLRIDDLEADRCLRPDLLAAGKEIAPIALADPLRGAVEVFLAARLQRGKTSDIAGPAQAVDRILDREQRRRVDGLANKQPFGDQTFPDHAEEF